MLHLLLTKLILWLEKRDDLLPYTVTTYLADGTTQTVDLPRRSRTERI